MARIHTQGATNRQRGRRDSLRALALVIMSAFLPLGLVSCALIGSGSATAPLLNINAPVPSGSGLYSVQSAQDCSGCHYTIVRTDAATGKPQWRQTLSGYVPQITVSDGVIYTASGLEALALRGSDGVTIWNTALNDSSQTQSNSIGPVERQLVVADGHVYILIGGGPSSPQQGQVVALRASDGARLWRHAFDGAESVAAGDGLVVVSTPGNGIVALHAADGSQAWQAPDNNTDIKVAQLLGGLVYVDEGPAPLIALDEHTGALVWTLPCWNETGIASSASGARIYIGCLEPHNPDATGEGVFAFDTQQRQLLWKYHAFNLHITPVVDSNLVFISTGTALDAVRASDGKRVWRQQAEEPNAGPVALARIGDTLYVRVSLIYPTVHIWPCDTSCSKRSYSLSALRPSDGAAYWRDYDPNGTLWLIAA